MALREALRDQPYGVLALGDGALLERTNRAHVVADGRLVVLDYQQAHVYQRLKTLAEARDGRWHPLETEPLERMEQIQSFVRARTEGFSAAESVAVSSGRFGEVMKALEAKLVS